jgi:hypothetical protein
MEVLFLAVNGYGIGASKLLRGLYERAVALAYIVKRPEKAERFVRFAAIQEHKAVNAARKITSQEEFDAVISAATVTRIRKSYDEIKPEFQVTQCKCGRKGLAISWDMDVASMAHDVGDPYPKLYLSAYVLPNLHIHATLASIHPKRPNEEEIAETNIRDGGFALLNATNLLLLALRSQDALFSLNLIGDIEACKLEVEEIWKPPDTRE